MNARVPDGFFPRSVCCTSCCGVARALASGGCDLVAVRTLLIAH